MNMHEAMVQDIDSEIERLKIVRAYHAAKIAEEGRTAASAVSEAQPIRRFVERVAVRRQHAAAASRHGLAEILLRENGKPMTTGELLAASQAKGLDTDGDERGIQNAFFTSMSRHPETFVKVDRGLWGLVGRDGSVS